MMDSFGAYGAMRPGEQAALRRLNVTLEPLAVEVSDAASELTTGRFPQVRDAVGAGVTFAGGHLGRVRADCDARRAVETSEGCVSGLLGLVAFRIRPANGCAPLLAEAPSMNMTRTRARVA
ncbi:hypothetical protein [Streptomyces sp. NPDC002133]|uniref:hypothetical protein n=1 Tax=Streptomyces sp. NPDC002133 TaxID=3154409 RepID=UPI0033180BFA